MSESSTSSDDGLSTTAVVAKEPVIDAVDVNSKSTSGRGDDESQNILCRGLRRRREATKKAPSTRTKKLGSSIAATTAFLIFTWAIRSCIPPEVITWHRKHHSQRHTSPSSSTRLHYGQASGKAQLTSITGNNVDGSATISTNSNATSPSEGLAPLPSSRRRLRSMELHDGNARGNKRMFDSSKAAEGAPDDLKRMHKRMNYDRINDRKNRDPRTSEKRNAMPLDEKSYKLNPLIKPDGYPWHRWSKPSSNNDGYALNTTKFVSILSRLGKGENDLGAVTPNQYTVGGVELTPDTIRLGTKVRPYIIRNGTVLRPDGRTGMFVTLVQRAVEMATSSSSQSPRMKLLSEGDIPLIFDANDYPWCGDDLVPIFRLNAIAGADGCKHAWPAMSLTYFSDPTNVQLTESPYQWDAMMSEWDAAYGKFDDKISKVVWRGRITGYTYRDGERPRQNLIRYSRDYLDIMDIKPSTKKSLIKQDDFQLYKAILDIDGNAWSARLGKLLCYNSVVIKVEPEFVGYWEKEIQPWVHYIPVASDFSDLAATVRYVIDPQNSQQMQQIVKNSQQFCRTKLTTEQYAVDMLWTLLSYAELLANSPDFYDAWRWDKRAYEMPALAMRPWRPRISTLTDNTSTQ